MLALGIRTTSSIAKRCLAQVKVFQDVGSYTEGQILL